MIIDKQTNELYSLIGNKIYSEYITDLKKVPTNIQSNVDNYLSIILEKLNSEVEFKEGCISDLGEYFGGEFVPSFIASSIKAYKVPNILNWCSWKSSSVV